MNRRTSGRALQGWRGSLLLQIGRWIAKALVVLVVFASAVSVIKTIHDHGGSWSALDEELTKESVSP